MPQSDLIITDPDETLSQAFTPTQPQPQLNQNQRTLEEKIFQSYLKHNTPKLNKKNTKSKPKPIPNPKPINTPVNTKTIENKTEKEKKIIKILKYQNHQRFAARLKKDLGLNYTREKLLKCSNDNLDSILFRIRNYLNNSNMEQMFEHLAKYCAKGYEDLVSQFIDIDGFSDLLINNPAFWDCYTKWQIEREMPDIPPSIQMVYIITSTTYIAYLQNRMKNIKPQKIIKESKKENKKENNKKNKNEKTEFKFGDII